MSTESKKERASNVVNGCKLIAVMWILIPINQGQCVLLWHPCMGRGSRDLTDTGTGINMQHMHTHTKMLILGCYEAWKYKHVYSCSLRKRSELWASFQKVLTKNNMKQHTLKLVHR